MKYWCACLAVIALAFTRPQPRPTPTPATPPPHSASTPPPFRVGSPRPSTPAPTPSPATPKPATPKPVTVSPVKPTPKPVPPQPVRPREKTIEERLIATYAPLVGMQEKPIGSNRGELIDKMNLGAGASLRDPWCASLADWGQKLNGLPAKGAYSPSWYSKARVIPPAVGAIGLVWFPNKGRYAHTIALIESVRMRNGKPYELVTVEGNTNSQGSREGHGCFRRIRTAGSVVCVLWR